MFCSDYSVNLNSKKTIRGPFKDSLCVLGRGSGQEKLVSKCQEQNKQLKVFSFFEEAVVSSDPRPNANKRPWAGGETQMESEGTGWQCVTKLALQ